MIRLEVALRGPLLVKSIFTIIKKKYTSMYDNCFFFYLFCCRAAEETDKPQQGAKDQRRTDSEEQILPNKAAAKTSNDKRLQIK